MADVEGEDAEENKFITPDKQQEVEAKPQMSDEAKKQKKADSARRLKEKMDKLEAESFEKKVVKRILDEGLVAFEKQVSKTEEYHQRTEKLKPQYSMSSKFTYYFFMRHGERLDFYFKSKTPEEYKNHPNAPKYMSGIDHDPPLTVNGLEQAKHTGRYLQRRIPELEKQFDIKFDEIVVETSPWVRTLQTASQVAQVLGLESVEVNYLMSENPHYLKTWDRPLPEAFDELALKVNKDLSAQALNGVEVCNNEEKLTGMKDRWSDGQENLSERAGLIRDHYVQKHACRGSGNVAYIIATHQTVCKETGDKFANDEEDFDNPGYCGSFEAFSKDGKDVMILKSVNQDYMQDFVRFSGLM